MSVVITGWNALVHHRDIEASAWTSFRLVPAWSKHEGVWCRLEGSSVIASERTGSLTLTYATPSTRHHVEVDLDDHVVLTRDQANERVVTDLWMFWQYAEKRFTDSARMQASILHTRAVRAYQAKLRSAPPGTFDPNRIDADLSARWLGDESHPGALHRLQEAMWRFQGRIDPHRFVNGWVVREAQDAVWSLAHISHRMRPYVSQLRSRDNDVRSTYDALIAQGEAQRAVLAALSPHVEAFCEPYSLSVLEKDDR